MLHNQLHTQLTATQQSSWAQSPVTYAEASRDAGRQLAVLLSRTQSMAAAPAVAQALSSPPISRTSSTSGVEPLPHCSQEDSAASEPGRNSVVEATPPPSSSEDGQTQSPGEKATLGQYRGVRMRPWGKWVSDDHAPDVQIRFGSLVGAQGLPLEGT